MKHNLTFRNAIPADLPYLMGLRKATMEAHLLNSGIATNDHQHLERIQYQFDNARIILYQQYPIGLLKMVQSAQSITIIQIQILPEYQNRGIGKQILSDILRIAQHDNNSVTLNVLKENPAITLYKKTGFTIVSEDIYSYSMQWFPSPQPNLL